MNKLIEISINFIDDKKSNLFKILLVLSILMLVIGIIGTYRTFNDGLVNWGIHNKVSWGIAIVNFIYWIGLAHAGTLISAILFLLNQGWRVHLNRLAEVMTVMALIIGGLFPIIHTGRPWFAVYWLLPYFNQMSIMPNFKSPLTWDIFAILSYFIVSILFLSLGMLPDIYSLRDRVKSKYINKLYRMFTFFWSGSKKQWKDYHSLYLLFAGILTPLVISVHSIVSFDFYVSVLPAWHTSILPPYFVVGAIFSGCAMVVVMSLLFNKLMGLKESPSYVLDKLNKIILTTSMMISFVYLLEYITGFIHKPEYSGFIIFDNFNPLVILMIILNSIIPLMLFFKRIRINSFGSILISLGILIGMWIERYIFVVFGQEKSFMEINNSYYHPTITDISILIGSFGLFLFLILIFSKIFPIKSLIEIRLNNLSKTNE
jgi:Ni/Fe-hydrogenase subunit HybB-like protein